MEAGAKRGTAFVQHLNHQARDAVNEAAALHAAFRVGVFDALLERPASPQVLCDQLKCQPQGIRALTEVALGLGYLAAQGNGVVALGAGLREILTTPSLRARIEAALPHMSALQNLQADVRLGAPPSPTLDWYAGHLAGDGTQHPRGSVADFIDRFIGAPLRTQALITSSRVELLGRLARGAAAPSTLATELQLSAEGVAALLAGLVAARVVVMADGKATLTPDAAFSLDATGLPYFERALPATQVYWEAFARLHETVKTGHFVLDLQDPTVAAKVYGENASRISGIIATHVRLGRAGAAAVQKLRSLKSARVLDVGTGSGVWGAAFALADPSVQVTYLDSERVIPTVRDNLTMLKLIDRANLWPADCATSDFGTSCWDVIILAQVLPVFGPVLRKSLLERVAKALAPGGVVAVAGYLLSEDRDGPMDAICFSLRRFVTNEGEVLTFGELKEQLAEVGVPHAVRSTLPVQELVVGHRGDLPPL